SNPIRRRAIQDIHAVHLVPQGGCTGPRGADEVPFDDIEAGSGVADPHAAVLIAGDHVPGRAGGCGDPAYDVVACSLKNVDAVGSVRQRGGPIDGDADQVALDEIRARSAGDLDAVQPVAGDEVPGAGDVSSDRVV